MSPDAIDAAARALVTARTDNRVIAGLDPASRPRTVAEGYAVQRRFRELWPGQIAGWKVGATARPIMQRFGLDEPMLGPFYAADVYRSPARPAASHFRHLCLETEFTFRFGRGLPPRSERYTRAEIAAAVDAVVPSFELINPRYERIPFDSVAEAIADCGLNGGMVLGEPIGDWRALDLVGHKVRLVVDGAVKGEGTGALALDDPVNVLELAVNALDRNAIGITSGQHIATGTMTGVVYIEAGQTAVGDFGSLGGIEVRFD